MSARALMAEVRELAERYGHIAFVRFIDGSTGIMQPYILGEWDSALDRANAFTRAVEEGSPHYHAAAAYSRRGLIEMARGDDAAALKDSARALELARQVGDPQILLPVLLESALVYTETGDRSRAIALFDETVGYLRELPDMGFAISFTHTIAWLARVFGREAEVEPIFSAETVESRWLRVAETILAGDLRGAAEMLADMNVPAFEAFYRLRAAEALVGEGRRAEADEQLGPALAFYRSVGATRYVREGEALLAASA